MSKCLTITFYEGTKFSLNSEIDCSFLSLSKDKSKEYFIKTYGVENASQVQENKDKKKKKAVEIYGVENISQSNIIKNK
jgi:hypothetical protein